MIVIMPEGLAFVQDDESLSPQEFAYGYIANIATNSQDICSRCKAPGIISYVEFPTQPNSDLAANRTKKLPFQETPLRNIQVT